MIGGRWGGSQCAQTGGWGCLLAKPQLAKSHLRGACSLIGAVPARPEALHVPLQRAEASIRRRN